MWIVKNVLSCSSVVLDPRDESTFTLSIYICPHSSAIMIDSSIVSHVHVLMLSIQAVCVVFLTCVHLALFLALSLSENSNLYLTTRWWRDIIQYNKMQYTEQLK